MRNFCFDLRIFLVIASIGSPLLATDGQAADSHDQGETAEYLHLSDREETAAKVPARHPAAEFRVTDEKPRNQGPRRLSILPVSQRVMLTNVVKKARGKYSGCGAKASWSSTPGKSQQDGLYRMLNQELNCNSKLPSLTKVSLVNKIPDGMCCNFDGMFERNGGFLAKGKNYYGDKTAMKQAESSCRGRGGRWFYWNNDILTNASHRSGIGDMFPYARKIKTEEGEIWEPVDWKGTIGAKWLATSEPSCPQRTISPLIVDFGNSGVPLSNPRNGVLFDLTASGNQEQISWPTDHRSMFLLLDRDDEGKLKRGIVDGSSLFGNYRQGPDGKLSDNGFLALAKYDSNGDGVIDAADPVFTQLRLWSDDNRNATAERSELHSLADMGVRSISLAYSDLNRNDEFGNSQAEVGSLTLTNGQARKIYDVWFAVGSTQFTGTPAPANAAKAWSLAQNLPTAISDFLDGHWFDHLLE